MGHAFAVGLHRVELDVYAFNTRARHVYEKLGFVLEGTKRQALRFDDGWVDCHVMGLLAIGVARLNRLSSPPAVCKAAPD